MMSGNIKVEEMALQYGMAALLEPPSSLLAGAREAEPNNAVEGGGRAWTHHHVAVVRSPRLNVLVQCNLVILIHVVAELRAWKAEDGNDAADCCPSRDRLK